MKTPEHSNDDLLHHSDRAENPGLVERLARSQTIVFPAKDPDIELLGVQIKYGERIRSSWASPFVQVTIQNQHKKELILTGSMYWNEFNEMSEAKTKFTELVQEIKQRCVEIYPDLEPQTIVIPSAEALQIELTTIMKNNGLDIISHLDSSADDSSATE